MIVSPVSKLIAALVCYLIGAWVAQVALEGGWSGLTLVGAALLLYGVWYSTVRGRRDWGDIAIAAVIALLIGDGLSLLWYAPELTHLSRDGISRVIGTGHLIGLVILAAAWIPLRRHGLLPGESESR